MGQELIDLFGPGYTFVEWIAGMNNCLTVILENETQTKVIVKRSSVERNALLDGTSFHHAYAKSLPEQSASVKMLADTYKFFLEPNNADFLPAYYGDTSGGWVQTISLAAFIDKSNSPNVIRKIVDIAMTPGFFFEASIREDKTIPVIFVICQGILISFYESLTGISPQLRSQNSSNPQRIDLAPISSIYGKNFPSLSNFILRWETCLTTPEPKYSDIQYLELMVKDLKRLSQQVTRTLQSENIANATDDNTSTLTGEAAGQNHGFMLS